MDTFSKLELSTILKAPVATIRNVTIAKEIGRISDKEKQSEHRVVYLYQLQTNTSIPNLQAAMWKQVILYQKTTKFYVLINR